MILNRYDAEKLRRDYPGASFRPLDPGETWQAGKLFFCGYWHKAFRVLEIREDVPVWGTVYHVLWSGGTENAHCTRPDPRYDFEIVPAAGPWPGGIHGTQARKNENYYNWRYKQCCIFSKQLRQ